MCDFHKIPDSIQVLCLNKHLGKPTVKRQIILKGHYSIYSGLYGGLKLYIELFKIDRQFKYSREM